MATEEPGFLLQRVPVHSMKEVWGILEVRVLFALIILSDIDLLSVLGCKRTVLVK
jgi:hypothetical protein